MNKGGKIAAAFFLAGSMTLFGASVVKAAYDVNEKNILTREKTSFLEEYFNGREDERIAYATNNQDAKVISDLAVQEKIEQQDKKIEEAKSSSEGAALTAVLTGVLMAGAGAAVDEFSRHQQAKSGESQDVSPDSQDMSM